MDERDTEIARLREENERLKEMNCIQRIALDFDPFAENRELKSRLAQAREALIAADLVIVGPEVHGAAKRWPNAMRAKAVIKNALCILDAS